MRHPFAVAQPWLGAYYSLREGDVAAMKNRDRRMDKAPQKRAAFMTAEIERREMAAAIEREPWRNLSNFDRGNIYEVEYRPMDGKVGSPDVTERVVGLCLGVHRRAFGASFRLLCKPDDCPTEYQFQIFSPTLLNVTLRQTPKKRPRFSKLYYMRERIGDIRMPKLLGADEAKKPKKFGVKAEEAPKKAVVQPASAAPKKPGVAAPAAKKS